MRTTFVKSQEEILFEKEFLRLQEEQKDFLNEGIVLKEEFFGKSGKLKQAEKECDTIIRLVKEKQGLAYATGEFRAALKSLENLLKTQFNFESVTIDFGSAAEWFFLGMPPGAPNAFTMPFRNPLKLLNFSKNTPYLTEKSSDGYRFAEPSIDCYIGVTTELLEHLETGGELLSIILHEVGHNFYAQGGFARVLMGLTFLLSAQVRLLLQFSSWIFRNRVTNALLAPLRFLSDIIYKLFRLINENEIIDTIKSLLEVPSTFLMTLYVFVPNTIQGVLTLILKEGYHDEKFADNFATVHGYGKELSDAMSRFKFTKASQLTNDATRKNIVLRFSKSVTSSMLSMIHITDPHPESINRIKNQIK